MPTFIISTTPISIQFNEVYTLPANQTDGIATTNVLPTASYFAYANPNVGTSEVIQKSSSTVKV